MVFEYECFVYLCTAFKGYNGFVAQLDTCLPSGREHLTQ